MRGEFLDLNGIRLYYYAAGTRGAGEPVVLLHGFPTSGHLWHDVVPLLPAGHRVIVLDLLGFGRSDPPAAPVARLDLTSHAERVLAVLDTLGIGVACVAGHDIGGGIAQTLAARHPDRVSRIALVSSVGFDAWPSREVRIARATLPLLRHLPAGWILSAVRADLLRGYRDQERGSRDIDLFLRPFAGENGRDALIRHLDALRREDTVSLGGELGKIRAPTTIIWGERDPFLPVSIGERLHAAIPGSTLQVVPDARHFLPLENAHAVGAGIATLLGR